MRVNSKLFGYIHVFNFDINLKFTFGQMKETWSEDDEQIITLIPVNTC